MFKKRKKNENTSFIVDEVQNSRATTLCPTKYPFPQEKTSMEDIKNSTTDLHPEHNTHGNSSRCSMMKRICRTLSLWLHFHYGFSQWQRCHQCVAAGMIDPRKQATSPLKGQGSMNPNWKKKEVTPFLNTYEMTSLNLNCRSYQRRRQKIKCFFS